MIKTRRCAPVGGEKKSTAKEEKAPLKQKNSFVCVIKFSRRKSCFVLKQGGACKDLENDCPFSLRESSGDIETNTSARKSNAADVPADTEGF